MKFPKALLIVGATRSEKGTIADVLEKLAGENNCCPTSMELLASSHGLEPLVGKTVAIMGDERLDSKDAKSAVKPLLKIIGKDKSLINPNGKKMVEARLQTRFLILSNELPRFSDASGAIIARLLLMQTTQSFLGREDMELKPKLFRELPGIFRQCCTHRWQRLGCCFKIRLWFCCNTRSCDLGQRGQVARQADSRSRKGERDSHY